MQQSVCGSALVGNTFLANAISFESRKDEEDDCSVVTSGFVDTLVSDNLRSRATGFLLTFDLNEIFLSSKSLSLSDESGGGAT
jgi:hypothetical protein